MKGKHGRSFCYLVCINILDGFITYWGIQYGWIEEANPLMRAVFKWIHLFS
ncbi:DUF5658 family protein [Guptibacillus hwajinpoensis]|uniref:DUF5658 family protein n=1 Tax=Guptibacillus hwajinpoensis TaxID=208199 RepID=UPI003D160E31